MMNGCTTDRPVEALVCTQAVMKHEQLVTVRLSRGGTVQSKRGTYILDALAAKEIITAFQKHAVEIPIDYEHQTLGGEYSAPNGMAPAAGWIVGLHFDRDRGLMAQARWNPKARAAVRSGEYRYLSPVLVVREFDRRAVALHSVALTNCPAIPRMEALAASARGQASADEPTAVDVPIDLMRRLRDKLKLGEDATATAVIERALEALSTEGDARLMELGRGNVLNPNDKQQWEAAKRLALSDRQTFEAIVGNLRPFVQPGRTTPPPRPTAGSRATVIANAAREFRTEGQHQRLTTCKAFVDLRLREAEQERLSDAEAKQLE